MSMKDKLLRHGPHHVVNLAITAFNTYQYKIRQGGRYQTYRDYYLKYSAVSESELAIEHKRRLDNFLNLSVEKSSWYRSYVDFGSLLDFPILNKQDLINNLDKIATISEREGVVSLTGGTTGASMKVFYTKEDTQERHALLDHFRAQHGYELGKKCAWFSGKNIVSEKNLKKGICFRDDYFNKIRFFSTFHINQNNFDIYWKSLNEFKPEFIVGFPSSVYEICEIADSKGLILNHKVKVFFPTAETVLPQHREVINRVLGCKLVDQYASSEGAPFILECVKGRLHIHPLTGVFEVVDENMQPAMEGELLVTSFATKGTPLIRYRVGDRIRLAPKDERCSCGSVFPIVDKIEGRSTDYVLSPTYGKVNLGNISNSTKDVLGIIQFQVIQHSIENLEVLVVASNDFTEKEQYKFEQALAARFGLQLEVDMKVVDQIPKEKSGKFRLVKNLIV